MKEEEIAKFRDSLIEVLKDSISNWSHYADLKSQRGDGISAGELRENAEELEKLLTLIKGF